MSSGFGELSIQAHDLVAAGDLTGARDLLGAALSTADPSPATASPELAEAAGLQARVLVALGEAHSARGWAAFAHAAATRLYGPSDQRSIAATATLAAVLHRVGSHARAARLYHRVIIELTAVDGPESLHVLAAHADLATVEYARGECEVARNRLRDAWEMLREVYGDGHASGIRMVARLGVMERDCGQLTEAHERLALARELCRAYLPVDHPLASQVDALAGAAANPDHRCAAGTPPPPDRPPALPERPPDRPDSLPAPPGTPPAPPDNLAVPPHSLPSPPGGPPASPPRIPAGPPSPVPSPRAPLDPGPSVGTALASNHTGAALELPGRPAGERADPDGVPRVWYLPEFRRRPAPATTIHRVHRRPRWLLPIVVTGLVVVLLGTAAVVANIALVGHPAPEPSAPAAESTLPTSTSGTGPHPSTATGRTAPGAPPTGVTLRDNRDNVALAWTYPPGAEGPVVVSGGRTRQELRAFQELPPGSNSFIVYGLNRNTDYCFMIAVVYSVDLVGRAEAFCTARSGAPPRR